MSLASKLAAPKSGRRYELLLDKYLSSMSKVDRDATTAALHNTDWSNRALAAELTDSGYPISEGAVFKWRNRNRERA